MNDSWNKYIQPILDSWEWDHYSWVWDPFLAKYPKLTTEQRTQVEDALVTCAFDVSDEDLAIKALGIAEILHTNHLATSRLSELFRSALRKQLKTLELSRKISEYYVTAFSSFELGEATPFIKSAVGYLEKGRLENVLDERSDSYKDLFRACCISLLRLKDDDALAFFVLLMKHDLRIRALTPNFRGTSQFQILLVNCWNEFGSNGLRIIVKNLQMWQKEELAEVLPLLVWVSERIRYRDSQEKQEVKMLIENMKSSAPVT